MATIKSTLVMGSGTSSIAVKAGTDTWLTRSTTCRAAARRRGCHLFLRRSIAQSSALLYAPNFREHPTGNLQALASSTLRTPSPVSRVRNMNPSEVLLFCTDVRLSFPGKSVRGASSRCYGLPRSCSAPLVDSSGRKLVIQLPLPAFFHEVPGDEEARRAGVV